jgi:dTDP-glucose 4,6-dehydratase
VRLLIAGGAGFIGSNYVRHRLRQHADDEVRVLDKLTYAGRRENLAGAPEQRLKLIEGDIAERDAVRAAVEGCEGVINFAAESHVDRSIESPGEFIQTDVYGTYVLLEAARDAGVRHLQISTDEVYGDLEEGSAAESSPLAPSSPYAASKAGGDLIVSAFARTYGAEALILRASNNYGPYQHPEKLIPLCILNALAGDPLPVYGDGMQVRNWLFVEDCCAAIDLVLERGEPGLAYNAGGPDELTNLEVVRRILELTGQDESLIEHIRDRPGHDRRYSLASERLAELGWQPQVGFVHGLKRTVAWYRENEDWWGPIRSGEYREYYLRQYGTAIRATGEAPAEPAQ